MAKERQTKCKACGCPCRKRRRGPSYCPDCEADEAKWEQQSGKRRGSDDPERQRGAGKTIMLADAKETKQDAKLIERAVRERWPIGPRKRFALVQRLAGIVEKSTIEVPVGGGEFGPQMLELEGPADANAIAAGRVLVAMAAQNQADEHLQIKQAKPEPATNVQVNVGVQNTTQISVAAVTQAMLDDPEYLEFERARAMAADGYPGTLRKVREPGALEVSAPPGPPRQGANGHRNGQER